MHFCTFWNKVLSLELNRHNLDYHGLSWTLLIAIDRDLDNLTTDQRTDISTY